MWSCKSVAFVLSAINLFSSLQHTLAFAPATATSHLRIENGLSKNTFMLQGSNTVEFELQELRAQFDAMLKQSVRPKMLTQEKRDEIESYSANVIRNCPSPIPLKSLGDDNAKLLQGEWTLVFASENAALGDLPRESTVELSMLPEYKCEYRIKFGNTLGLKSITAKSNYIVDSSPVNPGLVTIVYQDIVSDVLGFKALPVGLFGMLQGRATYIETIWFDGKLWFERGYSPDGVQYFNIYIKK